MSPQEVIAKMNLRFQSGNSVPVDSSRITKEEWEVVKPLLEDENDGLVKQETNKQLREERNALAAHVERLREGIQAAVDSDWSVPAEEALEDSLEASPTESLAKLKAQWQAEAVSDFAFHHLGSLDQESAEIYASKLRRQAEDKTP